MLASHQTHIYFESNFEKFLVSARSIYRERSSAHDSIIRLFRNAQYMAKIKWKVHKLIREDWKAKLQQNFWLLTTVDLADFSTNEKWYDSSVFFHLRIIHLNPYIH